MSRLFYEFAILVIGNRIPINVKCIKINSIRRYFGCKYGSLTLIDLEDLIEFRFGYAHQKFTLGYQNHLGTIDWRNDGLEKGLFAYGLAYIPAVFQLKNPLLNFRQSIADQLLSV
jgi:hypothetical protein